jgi:hypothetical protein
MKLALVAPVHNRPLVTRLWHVAARRVARSWEPHHETRVYVAGDQDVHRALASEFGATFIEVPNLPLGAKINAPTEAAWRWGADYVVTLGSDNIITPTLAQQYWTVFTGGGSDVPTPYIGLRSLRVIEPTTQRALHVRGHAHPSRIGETIGPGRTFSRALLDALHGRPWPDKLSRGADFRVTLRLRQLGHRAPTCVLEGNGDAYLLDIKGVANMWSFDHLARVTHIAVPDDYERMLAALPREEWEIVRQLEHATCVACGKPRDL